MVFTINLDTLRANLVALSITIVLCAATLWWTTNHFVLSVLTDPRVPISRVTLESAVAYFPHSSSLQSRLAARLIESGSSETETEDETISHAENLVARAITLSRWNYENYLLLASIQERKGDFSAAETAIKTVLQLAPNYVDVQWRAGNFYLRTNKLAEAQNAFQRVLTLEPARAAQIFSLLWESTDGDTKSILQVAQGNSAAQVSGAFFLLQQNLLTEATQLFVQSDRQARLSSDATPHFIDGLIAANQITPAREVWTEIISASQTSTENLFWNGSFEELQSEKFQQFAWIVSPSKFANFGTSSEHAKSGKHALQISFSGLDTTRIQSNIKQLIAVTPGKNYRFECWAMAQNFQSSAPLAIAVLNRQSAIPIAVSNPVQMSTNQWQLLTLEFTAPKDASGVLIEIQRIPKFSFDEPTKGNVWFDDFVVTESK